MLARLAIVAGSKWRQIISALIFIKSLANLPNSSCSFCTRTLPNLALISAWPVPSYWPAPWPRKTSLIPVTWYNSSIYWSRTCVSLSSALTTSAIGSQSIWPAMPPFSANIAQESTGISWLSTPSLNILPMPSAAESYTPMTFTASVMIVVRVCRLSISLYSCRAM